MVELLAGVGILGFISLVTMKMMSQQQSNDSYIKARMDINKTTAELRTILNRPESCRFMLGGVGVGSTFTAAPSIPALRVSPTARVAGVQNIKNILVAGTKYGHFSLGPDSMKLVRNTSPLAPNSVELVIKFEIGRKSMLNFGGSDDTKEVEKKIPLQVVVNGASAVEDCGLVVSDAVLEAKKRFCLSLNAQGIADWDTTSIPTCKLRSLDCRGGKVPKKISNFGTISTPNPATGNPNCVDPINVIPASNFFQVGSSCTISSGSGTFKIDKDPSTGKFKLTCT